VINKEMPQADATFLLIYKTFEPPNSRAVEMSGENERQQRTAAPDCKKNDGLGRVRTGDLRRLKVPFRFQHLHHRMQRSARIFVF